MIDPVSAFFLMAIFAGDRAGGGGGGKKGPPEPPSDHWPPPPGPPSPPAGPPKTPPVPPTPKVKLQAPPAGHTSYNPPPAPVVAEANRILRDASVPIGSVVGPKADPAGRYTAVSYRKEPFGPLKPDGSQKIGVEAFTNHQPIPAPASPPAGPPDVTPVDNPPDAKPQA